MRDVPYNSRPFAMTIAKASLWRCGEIGRHAGFKIRLGQLSAGSSPATATITFYINLIVYLENN